MNVLESLLVKALPGILATYSPNGSAVELELTKREAYELCTTSIEPYVVVEIQHQRAPTFFKAYVGTFIADKAKGLANVAREGSNGNGDSERCELHSAGV